MFTTGPSWWCCCRGCLIFSDNFDCCSLDCIDPETLDTIPTQNLGAWWDWKNATGEWWKDLSTDPQYMAPPCNDGALYEVTGTGLLSTHDANENDGYYAQVDIVDQVVGTDFKLHIGYGEGDAIVVEYHVIQIVVIDLVDNYEVEVSAGGETQTIYQPISVRSHTLYVALNKQDGLLCVSVDSQAFPISLIFVCDVSATGRKIALENASGSAIPLELDNFYYYFMEYRFKHTDVLCWTCSRCYCGWTEDGESVKHLYPGTMYLHIHADCDLTGSCDPPGIETIDVELPLTTDEQCDPIHVEWYNHDDAVYGLGDHWRFVMQCEYGLLTLRSYLWSGSPPGWILQDFGTSFSVLYSDSYTKTCDPVHIDFELEGRICSAHPFNTVPCYRCGGGTAGLGTCTYEINEIPLGYPANYP